MKFGGTSMGSAERIRAAAALVLEQHAHRPVAVVVSAMSKVTDLLLDTMKHAEAGDQPGLTRNIDTLRARHLEAARKLEDVDAASAIEDLISEFERIVRGMLLLGDRPARSVDEAVAIGERLSTVLLSSHFIKLGYAADAVNAADVVVTDAVFGNASPLMEPTAKKASARINRCWRNARFPSSPASTELRRTGAARRWAGAGAIFRRRSSRRLSTQASCGFGPMSMES